MRCQLQDKGNGEHWQCSYRGQLSMQNQNSNNSRGRSDHAPVKLALAALTTRSTARARIQLEQRRLDRPLLSSFIFPLCIQLLSQTLHGSAMHGAAGSTCVMRPRRSVLICSGTISRRNQQVQRHEFVEHQATHPHVHLSVPVKLVRIWSGQLPRRAVPAR